MQTKRNRGSRPGLLEVCLLVASGFAFSSGQAIARTETEVTIQFNATAESDFRYEIGVGPEACSENRRVIVFYDENGNGRRNKSEPIIGKGRTNKEGQFELSSAAAPLDGDVIGVKVRSNATCEKRIVVSTYEEISEPLVDLSEENADADSTADLVADDNFVFESSYAVGVEVDLAYIGGGVLYLNLCSPIDSASVVLEPDYENCLLRTALEAGVYSGEIRLTNDVERLVAAIWPLIDGAEPTLIDITVEPGQRVLSIN